MISFVVGQTVRIEAFEDLPASTGEVVLVEDDCLGVMLENGEYAELYEEMLPLITEL